MGIKGSQNLRGDKDDHKGLMWFMLESFAFYFEFPDNYKGQEEMAGYKTFIKMEGSRSSSWIHAPIFFFKKINRRDFSSWLMVRECTWVTPVCGVWKPVFPPWHV